MKLLKQTAILTSLVLMTGFAAEARLTLRASELDSKAWVELAQGKMQDALIEFRGGDELPVAFAAEGDLFETKQPSITYVTVKRNFWIKPTKNSLEMSLDGVHFKKIQEVLGGTITAGAEAPENGAPANSMHVLFKAFLK